MAIFNGDKRRHVFDANGGFEMISTTIPLKIISVANMRMHWAVKAKLVKSQRQTVYNALTHLAAPPVPPLTIVLTRVAPRSLDGDNLQSGFKATRDSVADWLGIDDGSPLLDWQYCQRKGDPKTYSVEIEVI